MNVIPREKREINRAADLMEEFFDNGNSLWIKALNRLNIANMQDSPLEVSEDKKNVYVELQLPGISKDDIQLECKNGVLSVEAQREEKKENKDKTTSYSEISYGRIFRSIHVGSVDPSAIKAEFKNGILNITLPKAEKENANQIRIS